MDLLPVVGTGMAAGMLVGWATPFAVRWFNLPPAGFMYRMAQAGVAWGLAWGLRQGGLIRSRTANIFAGYGVTFAALGLVQDFQMGLVGAGVPVAAAPPEGLTGMGQDRYDAMYPYPAYGTRYGNERGAGNLGYYQAGSAYRPYGSSRLGYYQTI